MPIPPDPITKYNALHALILQLFSDTDLRLWLKLGPERVIEAHLPGENVSRAVLVERTIEALEQHGLIDPGFFNRLMTARPGQTTRILAVAKHWLPVAQHTKLIPKIIDHTGDAIELRDQPPQPPHPESIEPTPRVAPAPPNGSTRRPQPQRLDQPAKFEPPPSGSDGLHRTILIFTVSASLSAFSLAIFLGEILSLPKGITTIPKYPLLALAFVPGLAYSLGLRMTLSTQTRATRPLWLVWPLWLLVFILALAPFGILVGSLLGAWITHRLASRALARPSAAGTRTRLLVAAAATVIPAQIAYFDGPSTFIAAPTLSLVLWQLATGLVLWSGFHRAPPT